MAEDDVMPEVNDSLTIVRSEPWDIGDSIRKTQKRSVRFNSNDFEVKHKERSRQPEKFQDEEWWLLLYELLFERLNQERFSHHIITGDEKWIC